MVRVRGTINHCSDIRLKEGSKPGGGKESDIGRKDVGRIGVERGERGGVKDERDDG